MGVASVEFLETGGVVAAKIPPNMPARAKACLRAAAYPGMIASWVNDVWPLPSLYWWGWFHQFPFEELVELLYRGTQTMRGKSRWLAGWLSAAGFSLLGFSMARSEYIFVAIDLNRSYTQLQIAGGGATGGGLGGGEPLRRRSGGTRVRCRPGWPHRRQRKAGQGEEAAPLGER